MRIFTIFLLFGILCFARDNPFVSTENITKFTQVVKQDNHFEKVDFTLPDSARILKKVDVYYQNLDGSISRKAIKVDKKIDWHNKLILTYKKDFGVQGKGDMPIITRAKKSKSTLLKRDIKRYQYKNFISFEVSKKMMKIFTKDRKIRDFMVDKPYKIVVDFRRDSNFLTKTFKVKLAPFVSIVLGNHDKYYRVAIELDGQYIYKIRKEKGAFIITLR